MQTLFLTYNRLVETTTCKHFRYLYHMIEWDERLICIKGAKGVGKTTMLLQHIKQDFPDRTKAFYVSLDNIWFTTHTITELTEYLYTHGVTHLFLDEVHKYPNWILYIKNLYDSYPLLHIVFTGSSLLKIDSATADLSRRLRTYQLEGLSFREYLDISDIATFEPMTLDTILSSHQQTASTIAAKIKILPHFENYVRQGFYPFFLETASTNSYHDRIQNVVTTVIENDVPAVEHVEYETLRKAKHLLVLLAQMAPFTPNISSLCNALSVTRNQLIHLLSLLHRSALLRLLHSDSKGLKSLGKPEKILFDNPNLMLALSHEADIGTMRESLFAAFMAQAHTISYPKQGDLMVDQKYLFEIGGKGKGFSQIKDIPNSYVVADEIETGFGNKIPLWIFGFLY